MIKSEIQGRGIKYSVASNIHYLVSANEGWCLQHLLYEASSVFVQGPLKIAVGANELLILCVGDSAVLKNQCDDPMFRKHSCWIWSHTSKSTIQFFCLLICSFIC